jgi:hypothetical protein
MPIKSTIKDEIIYTEFPDELNYDVIINHIDYIFSLKNKMVNQYELHDHTNTQKIHLSADDIGKIAQYSLKINGIFQKAFLAVYTPNDYTFGIARMFEAFYSMEGHSIHVKIFRDREDALEFLKDKKRKYR